MTTSAVTNRGARWRVQGPLRSLAIGIWCGVLAASSASAQPLLPRSAVPSVAAAVQLLRADAGRESAWRPMGTGALTENALRFQPEIADPYPGTRQGSDIHRAAELTADIIGWVALGRVLGSSGYDQVAQSPKSWPRSTDRYAQRFATRSAQLLTIEVVRHGFAAALDRDPAYVRCACTGFGARFNHVAKAVVTDFDEQGTRRVGWPRFAGGLAGAVVLGQLQPGQGSAGTVAYRAITTVAGSFIGNAVKEIGLFGTQKAKPSKAP